MGFIDLILDRGVLWGIEKKASKRLFRFDFY